MMINQSASAIPKSRTIKMTIIFIFLTIIIFSMEYILRYPLHVISNQLLNYIHTELSKDHVVFTIASKGRILSNEYVFFGIILFVFNRENIFKPFCLMNIIFLCEFLAGLIKLIYAQDHPRLIVDEHSWAFPSKGLLLIPVFYMTLLRMFVSTKAEKIKQKICFITLLCLYITFIAVGEFITGYSNINQILFSILISFMIYFLMYEVIKINYSNAAKHFYIIVKYPLSRILLCNTVGALVILWLYFWRPYDNKQQSEANEAFCYFFLSLGNIGLLLGVKYELLFFFKDYYASWSQYNFDPQNEKEIIGNSLIDKISISKGVQWNKTGNGKFIGRLILFLGLSMICLGINLIGNITPDRVLLMIFIKILLPITLFGFLIGYGFKHMSSLAKLSNDNMFTMIRESI